MFRASKELANLKERVATLEQALELEKVERRYITKHYDEKVVQLRRDLDALLNRVPSPIPLHWSEEEEDLDYLRKTGQIDPEEYESLLQSAGFANAEVEFAAEDYPRLSRPS